MQKRVTSPMGLIAIVCWVFGQMFCPSAQAIEPLLVSAGSGENFEKLDPPYLRLKEFKVLPDGPTRPVRPHALHTSASNTLAVIAEQSDVRDQMGRATCSIFSAIALLENAQIKQGRRGVWPFTLDLSEEWLEYLATRVGAVEGSFSPDNFSLLQKYGAANEATLRYDGNNWKSVDTNWMAKNRCGHLNEGYFMRACLVSHFDPNWLEAEPSAITDQSFINAREEALRFKLGLRTRSEVLESGVAVRGVSKVKALLASGEALTLDMDFFYGAWNHGKAEKKGLKRNFDHWDRGIVGYPEQGSLDRKVSLEDPAGHSVVIVGFDDSVEVVTETLMQDGQIKRAMHRGVYYLKNSWGTWGFGARFELGGKRFSGYGMITQDYAHEFGAFFRLPVQ